jgi:gliding motility-associated-like protein
MRFIFLVLIFFSFTVNAQPPCSGPGSSAQAAVSLCGSLTFNQASLPPCTGVTLPTVTGSGCTDNITTDNAVWYRIHIYQSGTLGFTLTPVNASDDYDWQLMNITNRLPQDVYTTNLAVSFNLSATTGATGCSAAGTVDYNCAGATPKFNRMLTVTAGQDYLLMVNNWSNSGFGYGLSFTNGSAGLTNVLAPTITSVTTVGCNTSQLKITLSEDILCTSLTTTGSEFTVAGATVQSITSLCSSGTNAINQFVITFQNPLPAGANILNIANGTDGNTLLDVCNDPLLAVAFPFTVATQTPPVINQITYNSCTPTILKVALSKKVACNSISPFANSEFSVTPAGPVITNVQYTCSATGTPVTDTVLITLQNPLTSGNYNLVVNNGSDGNTLVDTCGQSITAGYSFLFTVPVLPTAPVVTPTVSYCINATAAQLTATGTNLMWYTLPTGGVGSSTAPTPSTTVAGVTTYYVSQNNGTCEGPRSAIAVTVLAAIPPPIVSTPVNICQNATTTPLTATGTNLLWYLNSSGGVGSTTAPTPPTTVSGIILYYVSQTIGGCESQRELITVNINTTPLPPTVVSPLSICQGSTPTPLTAGGTNLLWYNTFTGGVGSSTAPSPSTATAGTIIYYVSQSIGVCESPRDDIIVNIDVTPAPPTVTTTTFAYCQNQFAPPLSATGTNITWFTTATGGTGTTVTPVPLTSTPGVTNYYVAQVNGACQSTRVQIAVTVSPGPNTPTVTTPINVCQGATAPVINVTPSAGATLNWYTVPTGGVSSSTTPTVNTAIAGTTTHYVSQYIGACESPRAAIVVNVMSSPPVPIVTTPVTYCQNQTATALTANGASLLWYANSSGGTGSSTAPTPNTTITGTTTYYVSQSIPGACEGPRVGITVNVNPAPSAAPTVTTPVNYCVGSATVPLQATGTNLLWFTSLTGTGSATVPTPSSAAVGNTTYYVANSIGVCEGPKATILVNVLSYPTAPTVVTPQTFCPGSTPVALTGIGTNLMWYTLPVGGVGTSTAPVPSTATLGTTTYYVSQSNGTCESPRTSIVVDIANPLNVFIGNDVTICQGSSITFNPIVTPTGATYQWRPLGTIPTSTIDNVTLLDATVSPVDTALYVLKANIGSCTKEDTVKVNVIWKPIVDAGINTAICLGDSALLQGSLSHFSAPTLATYLWTPADSVTDVTNINTYVHPTKTIWYKLTASTTVAGYGCAFDSYDSVRVTLQPNVFANAGNDTIAVKNVPHQLNATGGVNYNWFSPTANIVNPFIKNPKAILNNDAVFYLEVRDAIGCVGYDTLFVKVYDGPTYYVPSAFTPNGDGVNDIFRAIPVGLANTVYFRVFDRFGALMFETNQYLKGWDGTYQGKPQPNGAYIWMVAGTDRNYKKVEMKGTVMIIR